MSLRILTGKFNRPPFVHNAFPPKSDEESFRGRRSSGNGPDESQFSDVSFSKSKRARVPEGLISLAEVKRLFGRLPHIFDPSKGDEKIAPLTHEAWKFKSEGQWDGDFVIKKQKTGSENLRDMVNATRYELWANDFGKKNFSELKVGDKKYTVCVYKDKVIAYGVKEEGNEPEVYIISRYIPSNQSNSHYRKFGDGGRLADWFSPFHYVLGLGDLPEDNVREINDLVLPQSVLFKHSPGEMPDRKISPFIIIDTGWIVLKGPLHISLASAYTNLDRSVWLGKGISLEGSMEQVQLWKKKFEKDRYVDEFLQGLQDFGIDRKEAERYLRKIVLNNIAGARRNIDYEISAFRNAIPVTILEQLNWEQSEPVLSRIEVQNVQVASETRVEVADGVFQVLFQPRCVDIPYADGTKIFLDFGRGEELLLVEGGFKRLNIKSMFDDRTGYLQKNEPFSSKYFEIINLGGTHIRIIDKQMESEPADRTPIRIYKIPN